MYFKKSKRDKNSTYAKKSRKTKQNILICVRRKKYFLQHPVVNNNKISCTDLFVHSKLNEITSNKLFTVCFFE